MKLKAKELFKMDPKVKQSWVIPVLIIMLSASVVWWIIAGQGDCKRSILMVWLSLASFMSGCLIGFLFSTHGEEETKIVGKLRDWLLGIITALTVAKATQLKGAIDLFAAGSDNSEHAFALGNAIFYFGLGFLFMYFYRELVLNVSLAQSQAERQKLEGTQQATQAIQHLQVKLPLKLLTGADYVDEVANDEEAENLRRELYKDEVETFLKQAEEAANTGSLDWDIVSKTAYIYYYRTYFRRESEEKEAAVNKAIEWILRALNMNPLHAELTMRYADMLGALKEYESAATVLEKLALRPEAPILAKQWLAYYLRFMPERLDDSIALSYEYHRLIPDETDTFFNIAYAFAHKYCIERAERGQAENLESENRKRAITNLRTALSSQPDEAERVKERWLAGDSPVKCLSSDKEFLALIEEKLKSAKTKNDKPEQPASS